MSLATLNEGVVKPDASMHKIHRVMCCQRQTVMTGGRCDNAILPGHRVGIGPQFRLKPDPLPRDSEIERQYPATQLFDEFLDLWSQSPFPFAIRQPFQTIEQLGNDQRTRVKIRLVVGDPLLTRGLGWGLVGSDRMFVSTRNFIVGPRGRDCGCAQELAIPSARAKCPTSSRTQRGRFCAR